jgi:hypothetical protein
MDALTARDYHLIVIDPIYKCLGNRDENASGSLRTRTR